MSSSATSNAHTMALKERSSGRKWRDEINFGLRVFTKDKEATCLFLTFWKDERIWMLRVAKESPLKLSHTASPLRFINSAFKIPHGK